MRKNSNYFKIAVWWSDFMKLNFGGFTFNWGHAITGADTPVGIELVREMCKRGAERVIMACDDVEVGQDVAVEIRGETNGDIIVEHCDMAW